MPEWWRKAVFYEIYTSNAHPWFAGDRSRYVTRPATHSLPNNRPSNVDGELPPNTAAWIR